MIVLVQMLFGGTFDLLNNKLNPSLPDSTYISGTRLDYKVDHQELFRASLNDTLLSRYTIRGQSLDLDYQGKKYALQGSWKRQVFDIDDVFNNDHFETSLRPVSNTLRLKACTKLGAWRLEPGVSFAISSSQDTLFIVDFPQNDVAAMNTYFLDLLPETFGDTIFYRNNYRSADLELFAKRKRLQFFISYSGLINTFEESHLNTSSDPDLAGPRESRLEIKRNAFRVQAGWEFNKNNLLWAGFIYHDLPLDWRQTLYPSDPIPMDIEELGAGGNRSYNAQLGLRSSISTFNISTTVSGASAFVIDSLSTPVLGYFLKILPISHQAHIRASSSRIAGTFHLDKPLYINRSLITPRFDVFASRFWSDIDFNALLEFGLDDIQVTESYIHDLFLFSFGCDADIALNRDLYLFVDIEQLIPYLRTVSPSQPPKPPDEIKRYGGLSVQAGVSMHW